MRVLLDTNIIIHRESKTIVNDTIGYLFYWLDKLKYTKCIHPITITEIKKLEDEVALKTILIKLKSYHELKSIAPLHKDMENISKAYDKTENDFNDSTLLNELLAGRIDILITEDKNIHHKASLLNINDRVYKIDTFLEKVNKENPTLVDYNVLSIRQEIFGKININDDVFFQSFKEDYLDFEQWFKSKSDETAYICKKDNKISAFLYLKPENEGENYSNIEPAFDRKKRLKIGSFKVSLYGYYLGERFLKIIFDNAIRYNVDEIYVTVFNTRHEQKWLIDLLMQWGFEYYGKKNNTYGVEDVYVRRFRKSIDLTNPRLTYPFISPNANVFMVPINPEYHTELFPDSKLKTESSDDFIENESYRNAIHKVYICHSLERNLKTGDIIVFYRTGGYHISVVTTLGIVENVIIKIKDEKDLIKKCRGRSVLTDEQLISLWNKYTWSKPFIVDFLYNYSFPKRPNMKRLIEIGIIPSIKDAPRGFTKMSWDNFLKIIKETESDENIIVH